jgi:VanZ family protein
MTAIFIASGTPNLTTLPAGLSDHLWHFIAYAALGAMLIRAVSGAAWAAVSVSRAWVAWLLAVGYGLTDEFHQSFVPGRFPAADDWAADALGAGVAILVVLIAAIGRRLEDRKV